MCVSTDQALAKVIACPVWLAGCKRGMTGQQQLVVLKHAQAVFSVGAAYQPMPLAWNLVCTEDSKVIVY